jgi:hypothetical protein
LFEPGASEQPPIAIDPEPSPRKRQRARDPPRMRRRADNVSADTETDTGQPQWTLAPRGSVSCTLMAPLLVDCAARGRGPSAETYPPPSSHAFASRPQRERVHRSVLVGGLPPPETATTGPGSPSARRSFTPALWAPKGPAAGNRNGARPGRVVRLARRWRSCQGADRDCAGYDSRRPAGEADGMGQSA